MDELFADGGVIRKLWMGEAEKYRDHLLRLDADSRRNRFGVASADELVAAHSATAMRTGTVLHGFLVDGVLRGVAELQPFGAAFPREAEIAFSIEQPWQSHGVGSALLERTLLAACNRGIKRVHMACLADNARMQQLARKFAAELSFDLGSVVGEVAAPHATPLSIFREWVADGHGFARAVLDVQARMLRPV
jgi:RimJ/RimL family protein N-acetyltransferase